MEVKDIGTFQQGEWVQVVTNNKVIGQSEIGFLLPNMA
jgi:hypothetical protein